MQEEEEEKPWEMTIEYVCKFSVRLIHATRAIKFMEIYFSSFSSLSKCFFAVSDIDMSTGVSRMGGFCK